MCASLHSYPIEADVVDKKAQIINGRPVVKRLLHCCRGLSDAIQVCSHRPYVVNNTCYIYHN